PVEAGRKPHCRHAPPGQADRSGGAVSRGPQQLSRFRRRQSQRLHRGHGCHRQGHHRPRCSRRLDRARTEPPRTESDKLDRRALARHALPARVIIRWSLPVRLTFVVACLALAVPATAARQELPTLSPAEAISRAASASPKPVRALFQFKVQNAAKSRGGYYLDSEKDFHSAGNLGVTIRGSAIPRLTNKYRAHLKPPSVGTTARPTGQAAGASAGCKG